MKKILVFIVSIFILGCSATSTRIDSKIDSDLKITTTKSEKEIIQSIIMIANENGFEQKTLNMDLGYIQYQTPTTLTTYPMELTIFISEQKDGTNIIKMSAMNANKNSLIPLAQSQVKRAIKDFSDELRNDLN